MHDEGMASEAAEFWKRRHRLDPPPDRRSDPDDEPRPILLLEVTDSDVVSYYERLSRRLDEFACLSPRPADSLHVTIKMFDVGALSPTAGMDSRSSAVQRVDAAISAVVSCWTPFEVTFPRFNLFPDVVYAEVDGGGKLAELNRALCDLPQTSTQDRDGERFIPHLTLGKFVASEGYDDFVGFLEHNRELSFPPFLVDELSLVAYSVAGGWPPTYERLERYSLTP